jgi:hypothetical protein
MWSVQGMTSVQGTRFANHPCRRFPSASPRESRRALTLAVRAPVLAERPRNVPGHDPVGWFARWANL